MEKLRTDKNTYFFNRIKKYKEKDVTFVNVAHMDRHQSCLVGSSHWIFVFVGAC